MDNTEHPYRRDFYSPIMVALQRQGLNGRIFGLFFLMTTYCVKIRIWIHLTTSHLYLPIRWYVSPTGYGSCELLDTAFGFVMDSHTGAGLSAFPFSPVRITPMFRTHSSIIYAIQS